MRERQKSKGSKISDESPSDPQSIPKIVRGRGRPRKESKPPREVCRCGECDRCKSRAASYKSRYFTVREENEARSGYRTVKFSPEEDDTLRKIYSNIKYENNAAKRSYKALPGRTPSQLFRRAAELGLIRRRERFRWTEEELRVVEAHAHCALETIQKRLVGITPLGFKRTRAAIASQIHANRFRTNLLGLHLVHLSEALGISHDTLKKYREQRMIRGQKIPSIDQHKDRNPEGTLWFFSNHEILMFVLRYPGMVDLRRVNQEWFMSLVEWGSRYDSETGRLRWKKSKDRQA